MHDMTNVPHKSSVVEIRGIVQGEQIVIIAAERDSKWGDGRSVQMASTYYGDHLFKDPKHMRQKIAADIAATVRAARDAGYAQAMEDVRRLIGAKGV